MEEGVDVLDDPEPDEGMVLELLLEVSLGVVPVADVPLPDMPELPEVLLSVADVPDPDEPLDDVP
ncbi:hypothetical protein D3871_01225 [Noviherbaspirillum saxi]|uniref:Uncharacterized protein n=1 Tax=Noviherbaspirillum saxi TaxID=2320863 RepID=A0A3A3FM59_9BURK|nr:hypothetical protein D3871_01225 [Noviherbaspirillum saxi]